MKDLEETKKEILDYVNQKGFNIFYGLIPDIRDTVLWNLSQGNWKDFINIAKNEDIKTLIYGELILSEELAELSAINKYQVEPDKKEDVQRLKELRSKLKSYKKYSENIAYVHLSWIKEGVRYLLQLASPWYDEFQEVYQEAQNFLKEKEETVSLEEKKGSLKETKEKLSLLSTQVLEWAKSEGLKRVTKGQVQVYLLENEIVLGWTEREMLYTMVNKELAKSYPK